MQHRTMDWLPADQVSHEECLERTGQSGGSSNDNAVGNSVTSASSAVSPTVGVKITTEPDALTADTEGYRNTTAAQHIEHVQQQCCWQHAHTFKYEVTSR